MKISASLLLLMALTLDVSAQTLDESAPPSSEMETPDVEAAPEPATEPAPDSGPQPVSGAPSEPVAEPTTAPDSEPVFIPETIEVAPLRVAPVESPKLEEDATKLEEIVVTANKRKESARSLAGAVTAIGRDRLDETGASNFGEYLSLSPGVNFNSGVPGYSVITIRGVSSDTVPGLAQTAVGIYYDDIPLTDPSAPMVVPDIDAFDAERVELLRGPQGALYGSASLGGAVNYIPQAPNLFASEFAAQASGSLATNSELGGSGKLMFNTPLFGGAPFAENGMGLRVVGHYTRTPGYIDNIGTGVEQSNASTTSGGRVILGWAPTLRSELRLTGLYQRTDVDDAGYVNPDLGDLKKSTLQPEPSGNEIRLASLRYELETDYGDWAFIAGYQDKSSHILYDGGTALGIEALRLRVPVTQVGDVEGYSAELRFVSPAGETFEWLAGISYADRNEHFHVGLNAQALANAGGTLADLLASLGLPLPGVADKLTLFDQDAEIGAPEAAAFLDATWRITPTLKLTAGGRGYRNIVDSSIAARGLLVLPAGTLEYREQREEKATGFNPKVSLAWQATPDVLFYGLYSKGYRLGGPNLVPSTPISPSPRFYGPDEVFNYEIGTKTVWLDGALSLDLSAFEIDWRDIPLVIVEPSGLFKYLDNAGNARIRGVETALVMRPFDFLTARSSVTWTDARLRNDFDPNNGQPPIEAGDRLPGSPEWTVTNTLTGLWYWGDRFPTVTLIHRYESASASNLSFPDVTKGDYHLFDLRAGLKLGRFGVTLFGKNLTDERGVTAVNNYAKATGDVLSLTFLTPPRAVGLELSYSFEQ